MRVGGEVQQPRVNPEGSLINEGTTQDDSAVESGRKEGKAEEKAPKKAHVTRAGPTISHPTY